MDEVVIRVEHLAKRYQLGERAKYRTIRDALSNLFARPAKTSASGAKATSNEFWALNDVSFDVHQGEVLGIIGRNGAGKSTLLKILSRITEPTRGKIEITGRVGSLLEVGTGFHAELTGRENIYLNGAILGMSQREIARKFDEIIAFSETEKFLDTPVKYYSSGMYMRLAFAVAANLEPDILIVDEVLAVGDAQFQNKCLGKMREISRGGRTVLFVSHNLGAIRQLCSSALYLERGRVAFAGSTADALRVYGDAGSQISDGMPDQFGRTSVVIRQFDVLLNGAVVDAVSSGDDVQLRLSLGFTRQDTSAFTVGFALESEQHGLLIINYSSFHQVAYLRNDCVISALLKRLPLVAGQYRIHLRIVADAEEIFWSTHLATLTVREGDFFGTGARGEESLCPWLYPMEWSSAPLASGATS